jgi:hypothetical protein
MTIASSSPSFNTPSCGRKKKKTLELLSVVFCVENERETLTSFLPFLCAQHYYGNNDTQNDDDVLKLAGQSRAFESLESVRQSVREFSAVQQQEVRERLGEIRNKIEEAF